MDRTSVTPAHTLSGQSKAIFGWKMHTTASGNGIIPTVKVQLSLWIFSCLRPQMILTYISTPDSFGDGNSTINAEDGPGGPTIGKTKSAPSPPVPTVTPAKSAIGAVAREFER